MSATIAILPARRRDTAADHSQLSQAKSLPVSAADAEQQASTDELQDLARELFLISTGVQWRRAQLRAWRQGKLADDPQNQRPPIARHLIA